MKKAGVSAEVYNEVRQQIEDEFWQLNDRLIALHLEEKKALGNWLGELSRVHEVVLARGLRGRKARLQILMPRLDAAEKRFLNALKAWRDYYISENDPFRDFMVFGAIKSVRATTDTTKAIVDDVLRGKRVDFSSLMIDIGVSVLDQMFIPYTSQVNLGGRPKGMSPETERLAEMAIQRRRIVMREKWERTADHLLRNIEDRLDKGEGDDVDIKARKLLEIREGSARGEYLKQVVKNYRKDSTG